MASHPPQAPSSPPLRHALKEWAVAVQALTEGHTILLLRKGGIREEQGRFEVSQRRVWLYPTYEHQRPDLVKPPYNRQVTPVPSGWHPDTIPIQSWADITHILSVSEPEPLQALTPFHIWTEGFAEERFKWKPRSPLYLLLLRVYRLPDLQTIAYRDSYGGCKSWIDLEAEQEPNQKANLDPSQGAPVLLDDDYQTQVNAIHQALA